MQSKTKAELTGEEILEQMRKNLEKAMKTQASFNFSTFVQPNVTHQSWEATPVQKAKVESTLWSNAKDSAEVVTYEEIEE